MVEKGEMVNRDRGEEKGSKEKMFPALHLYSLPVIADLLVIIWMFA